MARKATGKVMVSKTHSFHPRDLEVLKDLAAETGESESTLLRQFLRQGVAAMQGERREGDSNPRPDEQAQASSMPRIPVLGASPA
jgi:hypothetical protein